MLGQLRISLNSIVGFLVLISFFLLNVTRVTAAPKADAWGYWMQSEEASTTRVEYRSWDAFLSRHVKLDNKENNLVSYASVSNEEARNLDDFIDYMKSQNPLKMKKNEQFAYWVNFYNALTVQLILKNYPLKSITKLGGFFKFGPWDNDITEVNGNSMSLNDIEHRILRPGWKDSRIHYVVNCASYGCPNLQLQSLNPATLDDQLNRAATSFINATKGVSVKEGKVVLSSIYDWYAEDFGDRKALVAHLGGYLKNVEIKNLLTSLTFTVKYQYDWSLNEFREK